MEINNDKKFTALIDAAADGILLIDTSGVIKRVNLRVVQLFDYSIEELIDRNVNILTAPPCQLILKHYLVDFLQSEEAYKNDRGLELVGLKKNGAEFPINLSIGVIDTQANTRLIGILRDLTREKSEASKLQQAEEEIKSLSNRLAHASRVSAMAEMAAGISHEVNQPLTAIVSYAQVCRQILTREKPDLEKLSHTLEKIESQAARAGDILRRMRDWVKPNTQKREAWSCNDLIKDIEDIANLDIKEHNLRLQFDLEPSLPKVFVDSVQIQQVIMNLIHNAAEAMSLNREASDKGLITVKTQSLDEDHISVSVIDQGPGIDEAIDTSLFTPFFTTKAEGTGIGLSICRTIISSHGGNINVEKNPKGGIIFSFTLPVVVENL